MSLGSIAAALALISLCFFLPIVDTYLRTGFVPNFPTLIVCGFTMLAAIQSFFSGLTLQTIIQKNRQAIRYLFLAGFPSGLMCLCLRSFIWQPRWMS